MGIPSIARFRNAAVVLCAVGVPALAHRAWAQVGDVPAPATSASAATSAGESPTDAKLEEAKRLFRQGNELRRAGDCQAAVQFFVQSRAIVPSMQNTLNSAVCMDQVGRFDEALELHEALLTEFGSQLDPESKQAVSAAMTALRQKVGSLDVSANVQAMLVVDGRMRGNLPLVGPIRVMPGRHLVRVVKDGYETYEATVEVKVAAVERVDARLKALASAGRLRIDDKELEGAEVIVDGAPVGTAPWEGTLAPGKHVLWVRRGDEGSAPSRIVVVQGQTVLGTVKMGTLGPELRVDIEPSTAELYLGGVEVGRGQWRGRLPMGSYLLEAKEPGYRSLSQKVEVSQATKGEMRFTLTADPNHLRWGVKESGKLRVDVLGGGSIASSLSSGAESWCSSGACSSSPLAIGFVVTARGAYELPMGLGFGVGGGYMSLKRRISRTVPESFQVAAGTLPASTVASSYELDDELNVRGPLVFAGAFYRHDIFQPVDLEVRLDVGAWFASASDTISGTASAGGVTRPASVVGSGSVAHAAAVFALPGLTASAHFGSVRVGLGAAAMIIVTDGPSLKTGETNVSAQTCDTTTNRESIDCAPQESFTRNEKAFGRFVTWMPFAVAGYAF